MSFDGAYHLLTKPVVGPFAVQMEIYSVPEGDLLPSTAYPTKGKPYIFYRYSGSRTVIPDRYSGSRCHDDTSRKSEKGFRSTGRLLPYVS